MTLSRSPSRDASKLEGSDPIVSGQRNIGITGIGFCVPDKVFTNADIVKRVDTSDEWIVSRTGIRERRMLSDGETAGMIGAKAAERALSNAGAAPEEVDALIIATFGPERICPGTYPEVVARAGLRRGVAAFDLNAACAGFIYGILVGRSIMKDFGYRKVLVVGTEACTRFTNYSDRNTCVLWGDGAGAALLTGVESPRGILGWSMGADASGKDLISIEAGGSNMPGNQETVDRNLHTIRFEGREVFKFAVKIFEESMDEALNRAGITSDDIDLFVMHQANIRIIEAAAKRYGLGPERVYINVDRYGNTSAASIPIALSEAVAEGRLKPGMVVAMVAFGAGLTWASAVIRW